ncbi:MAG: hypothetical protein KGR18_12495, partial [Acidobacteria bacterium]|nr:hypothetical protein [Acidobacteriota bacterium]
FAPRLAAIGIDVQVSPVDTDAFGTFAGEIDRSGTARAVVEAKARTAIEQSGLAFGLASEGSFGPHPVIPLAQLDTELVVWVDAATDRTILEGVSEFSHVPGPVVLEAPPVDRSTDLLPIMTGLAEQAAIVCIQPPDAVRRIVVAKAIGDPESLWRAIDEAFAHDAGPVVVEPDLRAHLCPDRRRVIAAAIDRLVVRLSSRCPQCEAVGFGRLRTVPGLACALCELPTTEIAVIVDGCEVCGHECSTERTGRADPTHCDRCNP